MPDARPSYVEMNSTTTPLVGADPINAVALPVCAIIAILITYLPLQAFLTIKNFPAICIIVIVDVQNLFNALNAIIWPNDNFDTWWKGYGLCDIETWLRYPLSLAISCSLACFAKGMADALNTNKVNLHQTNAWKRRKLMKEAAFCWTAPIIQLGLYYIVSTGRYNIFPVFGCACQVDNSWPTAAILLIWNPIFSFINGIFAVQILMGLYNYRKGNGRTLASNNSGMPARKLMKLILISLILLIIYLPVQLLFIIRNWPSSLEGYSWAANHNPAVWNPILFYHTSQFPELQYTGWTPVGASAVMFIFFGFTDHAIDMYRSWLVKLGFAKLWPSLLEPRRQTRRGSSTWATVSRFSSKLDLIAKAVNYFEGGASRKSSQTTTTRGPEAEISGSAASRKESQGAIPLTHFRSASSTTNPPYFQKDTFTPSSSIGNSTHYNGEDAITPKLSPYSIAHSTRTPTNPEPAPYSPQRRGLFSLFRPHGAFLFPIFPSQTAEPTIIPSPAKYPSTTTQYIDPNAQYVKPHTHTHTHTHTPQRITSLKGSTNIWSSSPPSLTYTQGSSPSGSSPTSDDEDYNLNPYHSKIGTRAYREKREKQSFEFTARVVADNVVLPFLKEVGGKGVVVKKSFEVREEVI